jgi:hypothetical protein
LNVLRDPFHPDNAEQLSQYRKYRWQLLMRCDINANEPDITNDWEVLVIEFTEQLSEAEAMGRMNLPVFCYGSDSRKCDQDVSSYVLLSTLIHNIGRE